MRRCNTTLSEQIAQYEEDLLSEPPPADEVLFKRGLFLVGELDLTGKTVDEILSKSPGGSTSGGSERLLLLLGRLGSLVGKDQETDAATMGPVIATVEDLP